jgi:phenylalanyl-tRNA synthetase beta chain
MIVTYNWLREFVDFDLSPVDLAELLTMLGLEVERMESLGADMDDVVVAVVEERSEHPNANKLSLCRVNTGSDTLSVVCGARNFKVGDKVALAQIGTVLPGDLKIKRSTIRGEESFGMLCSERELGLAEDSAGIMVLPPEYRLGTPVFEALGLKDTLFEIGLTPNRADCLSVVGVAREIAAKLGKKITSPSHALKESETLITAAASVVVEDHHLCPRYTARHITGCRIAPSPQWLINRLNAVGIRSINNVVDVTNYVLMEYGHPLHAFDFDLIAGGAIVVKRAGEGERFTTLDGQERLLNPSDLTICDTGKTVALAGIMGGENSEITPGTTNILLESAYFNPSAIRLTGKRLGLHTESSHRFERGADIDILPKALDRAAALIAELAGGTVARGIIDLYPVKILRKSIQVRVSRVNQLLGINLEAETIRDIFLRLEFEVDPVEHGVFNVRIPSFRVDIEREIDLIEEVARLNGYENIPATMPKARVFSDRPARHQRMEKLLRELMVAQGFNEVINFSFIAPDALDKLRLTEGDSRRRTVALLNPLVDEQSVMRTTLLPGLLQSAARNLSYRCLNQRIFELRRVYLPRDGEELPDEPLCLAGLITGRREPEGWSQPDLPTDFYDIKGIVENICDACILPGVAYDAGYPESFYHPGKACAIRVADEEIGSIGEIHPDVQEGFGLEQPVYYFEINFERLIAHAGETATIATPSRFPDTFRDIAMLVDDETEFESILQCVRHLGIKEIEEAGIFDLYKGEHIPSGKKSVAIRIRYRSPDRTLTDDEVNRLHQRVITSLVDSINVSIR